MLRSITELLEYSFFLLLSGIAQRVPFRTASRLGARLGGAVFRLTPLRKRITLDNLAHAFPAKSTEERYHIAHEAYRNYGTAVVQMAWSWGQSEQALMNTVNPGNMDVAAKAGARGKGVILLSAHYGGWELLLSGLRLHLGSPLTAVVQRQRNRRIDDLIERHRSRFGNTMVPMGPAVREVMMTLRRGGNVLMLGDQSGPKESEFVEFFQRPAATHRGTAAFSLKTGASIVTVLLVRQADETYTAVFEEVDRTGLDTYQGDAIAELTRRHAKVLEKHIRLHPDHWLWMHKRWKHTAYFQSLQGERSALAAGETTHGGSHAGERPEAQDPAKGRA